MKKLILIVLCLCIWVIYLKKDAQVGVFENTPKIVVDTSGFFNYADNKTARLVFPYKGQKVSLPFSSIAYWVIE